MLRDGDQTEHPCWREWKLTKAEWISLAAKGKLSVQSFVRDRDSQYKAPINGHSEGLNSNFEQQKPDGQGGLLGEAKAA